jgi:hypothetical protein
MSEIAELRRKLAGYEETTVMSREDNC